jgi:hypothetical protein
MTDASLSEYVERTERERKERFAQARAEGCPPGWEEEWRTSSKFKMMVADKSRRS